MRLRRALPVFRILSLLTVFSSLRVEAAVDASTLQGKVLFGYQGWFDCPSGGQGNWTHWSRGVPAAGTLTVDLYPDLTEFDAKDVCAAGDFKIAGKQAYLYTARNAAVVDAHFQWMEENGLDGVFVQRFGTETSWKHSSGDVVLKNIMASAAKHGRVFAIEYDVSGLGDANINQTLQDDWKYLVDDLKVTSQPGYLHEGGKPVLAIWGLGLNDAGHPPSDPVAAAAFVKWFRTDAAQQYRVCYVGGTPSYWRGLNNDARTDAGWTAVYKSMDVVQPWTVGRYGDSAGADGWRKNLIAPDLAQTKTNGQVYMPVVFPGFSWKNLNAGPENQIPRKGGRFLWRQAMNAKAAGATMLKIAMFDEVDEGTAMFKVASKRSDAPDAGFWLTLDADGETLPSDWYLKLAGQITQVFHGSHAMSDTLPIRPGSFVTPVRPAAASTIAGLSAFPAAGGDLRIQAAGSSGAVNVYAAGGKRLRSLPLRDGSALWDRRDNEGRVMPRGIYMLRMAEGGSPGLRVVLP